MRLRITIWPIGSVKWVVCVNKSIRCAHCQRECSRVFIFVCILAKLVNNWASTIVRGLSFVLRNPLPGEVPMSYRWLPALISHHCLRLLSSGRLHTSISHRAHVARCRPRSKHSHTLQSFLPHERCPPSPSIYRHLLATRTWDHPPLTHASI